MNLPDGAGGAGRPYPAVPPSRPYSASLAAASGHTTRVNAGKFLACVTRPSVANIVALAERRGRARFCWRELMTPLYAIPRHFFTHRLNEGLGSSCRCSWRRQADGCMRRRPGVCSPPVGTMPNVSACSTATSSGLRRLADRLRKPVAFVITVIRIRHADGMVLTTTGRLKRHDRRR